MTSLAVSLSLTLSSDVVADRHGPKMSGVQAVTYAADVVDRHPLRDLTYHLFVDIAMSEDVPPIDSDSNVSSVSQWTLVQPTLVSLGDPGEDSFHR